MGNPFAAQFAAAMQEREVLVWPENVAVFHLFQGNAQWRTGGMGNPTSLIYTLIHRRLDRMSLSADEMSEWEDDLRIMEYAALAEMNKEEE